MIYLIKTSFYNKELNKFSYALKIGYTNDIKSRMSLYHSDNPYIELLSIKEGDQFIEGLYHNYFKKYRLLIPERPMNREWLNYNDEIIETFDKLSISDLLIEYKVQNAGERLFKKILLELFFDNDLKEVDNFQKTCEDIMSEWKLLIFREEDFSEFSIRFNKSLDKTRMHLVSSFNFLISPDGVVEEDFDYKLNQLDTSSSDMKLVFSKEMMNDLKIRFNGFRFNFVNKMQLLCDFLLSYEIFLSDLYWLPKEFFYYIVKLGPKRIKALGYKEADLKREVSILSSGSEIREVFISRIFIGKRYSLKELKDIIKQIYDELNLTKTPKASDVLEIFEVKSIVIVDKTTKKRIAGYEIISLKN